MVSLNIANTVTDLVQGDVRDHLPLTRIPLQGDVLGLGITAGFDNGELTFLHQAGEPRTRVYKSRPYDGGIDALSGSDQERHFPYVCFSDEASALRRPVDPALWNDADGLPLQALLERVMRRLQAGGELAEAPMYGLRLSARWQGLVITVASNFCLGQLRRNAGVARMMGARADLPGSSIYTALPHFQLGPEPADGYAAGVKPLAGSLHWESCGFWDTRPESGRLTVLQAGAHLHLHGCSSDLRLGGHLHHEHPASRLEWLERLAIHPLQHLTLLASDLAVDHLACDEGLLRFEVVNQGQLDASDVGMVVVIDDRWSSRRYLRLPWLAAGERQRFEMPLDLPVGPHDLLVCVDPEQDILEQESQRSNNRARLQVHG